MQASHRRDDAEAHVGDPCNRVNEPIQISHSKRRSRSRARPSPALGKVSLAARLRARSRGARSETTRVSSRCTVK